MGIMVYSLLWVMQDLYHQPYLLICFVRVLGLRVESLLIVSTVVPFGGHLMGSLKKWLNQSTNYNGYDRVQTIHPHAWSEIPDPKPLKNQIKTLIRPWHNS